MPTFYIEQFGCRATQADGAALERQLLLKGYVPAEKASADVVVVNTCTVTAAADSQARDAIRKIHTANRSARVVVTGCYAQRAPDELATLPGVAWVVGNSHKPELPRIIENISSSAFSIPANFVPAVSLRSGSIAPPTNAVNILTGPFERQPLLSAPVFGGEGHHTRPTLKIQDGCNSRCSYCVIPFVRGRSRSLPPETVIQEINRLTASGVQEIVLSGINLGTYGKDLVPRLRFESLLRMILHQTSVARLRLSSIEPLDVTQDLVEFFAAHDRMARHFHMPLQSGADRVLAAMHRWYRAEHYAQRVRLIRQLLPEAAIGADVIAGFPGETEEEHLATVAFIEDLPFTYLHVFSYSRRPGTASEKLSNEVPPEVIKSRARALRSLSERKSRAFRRTQIAAELRVLTLRSSRDDDPQTKTAQLGSRRDAYLSRDKNQTVDFTAALSSNYLRLRIAGNWPANQWLHVRVLAEEGNFVVAEPAGSSLYSQATEPPAPAAN